MTSFVIIGHSACTDGSFSLNDLPGSGGRMDILCRCVQASLFLSHDLRRDVECYLILCGEPSPPKTIRIAGNSVRSLSPDERSAGSLIRRASALPVGSRFRDALPGVSVRNGGLSRLVEASKICVLDEKGEDIRHAPLMPEGFLLSDHMNFSEEEEELVSHLPRYSVGPACLHADHAIVVVNNELDRRRYGWK